MAFKQIPKSFDRDRLIDSWWAFGLILPALLPIFEALGRGVWNSLFVLYVLVLLPFFWQRRRVFEPKLLLLFLLLFAVDFIGAARSINPSNGLQQWLKYSLSLLFFFVPIAFCRDASDAAHKVDRSFRALAFAAVAVLVVVVGKSLWSSGFTELIAPHALIERNLPFLLIFFLFVVCRHHPLRLGVALALTVSVLILSRGRSAFLGMLAGVGTYGLLVRSWRLRQVVLGYLVVAVLGSTLLAGFVFRQPTPGGDAAGLLDQFTSGRSVIWANAINHPPADPWFGIGMDNLRGYRDVLAIRRGDLVFKVGHLHNMFMDAWYETGILGLGLLLGLLVRLFCSAIRSMRSVQGELRARFGAVLAALVAIGGSSLLSFSYTSPQCTVYLFYLLGLAHCIERQLLPTSVNA